jgi:hypothetical protein
VDSLLFLVVAVVLYFASDGVLRAVEQRMGRRLEYRTLIFFGVLLVLTLTTFAVIRGVLAA